MRCMQELGRFVSTCGCVCGAGQVAGCVCVSTCAHVFAQVPVEKLHRGSQCACTGHRGGPQMGCSQSAARAGRANLSGPASPQGDRPHTSTRIDRGGGGSGVIGLPTSSVFTGARSPE